MISYCSRLFVRTNGRIVMPTDTIDKKGKTINARVADVVLKDT